MKRVFLLLIVGLFSIYIASAAEYSASYECRAGDLCVEGEEVSWTVTITGDVRADLISVRTMEPETEETVSLKTYDKVKKLYSNESYMAEYTYEAPSRTIDYVPCFKLEVKESGSDIRGDILDVCDTLNPQTIKVVPLAEKQCDMRFGDDDCDSGLSCIDYKCTEVVCGECQYVQGGQCFDYECCEDSACPSNSVCENRQCQAIVCPSSQKAEGHKCVDLICADNQYALAGTCVDLTCQRDEVAVNHRCEKLECGFLTTAQDGECAISLTSITVVTFLIGLLLLGVVYARVLKHKRKHHFMEWDEFHKRQLRKGKVKIDTETGEIISMPPTLGPEEKKPKKK